MADNSSPTSYDPLIQALEDAADGAHTHGATIGLYHCDEAHIRADTTWRRPVWPLGARRNGNAYAHIHDPFGLADDAGLGEKPAPVQDGSELLTPAERIALDVLELSWPLTLAEVKSRYKELVKLHHPDANGGAREAEEKLKEINAAYSTLRVSENIPAA